MYEKPTTTQAEPEAEKPAITIEPEPLPPVRSISDLLDWAERHTDTAVRKYAKQARAALTVIQQRHAVDAELETVLREADELRQRLAELDARAKQLKTPAAKQQRDYTPSVVRAWAREQGLKVPEAGVLPQAIVQAWRERSAA